jgi:hypothetical protein
VAADLIVFTRTLVFLMAYFGYVTKKSSPPKNEQTIHSKISHKKISNVSKNILEQTIQIMRHKKGKNKGGNRFLAI